MTDVGIRTSALDHTVAVGRSEGARWGSGTSSFLPWDLTLAAGLGVALSLTLPIASRPVMVLLIACWGACLVLARATEASIVGTRSDELVRVLRAGAGLALFGSALSIAPGSSLTAGEAFGTAALLSAIACGARVSARARRAVGGSILVVGDADTRRHAVSALERRPGQALDIVEVCLASDAGVAPIGEVGISLWEVPTYAKQVGARCVVAVPGTCLDPLTLRRLQWLLEGERLTCFVGTGLLGVASGRLTTADVSGLPLLRIRAAKRSGPASVLVDWMGRCLAAIALTLLLPVLLVLAIAIRRESPGPALFCQTRVGRDGRQFTIYKLRTMTTDSRLVARLENDCDGVLFKMRQDPRITPLGGLLRKYSLDELPQLANVVLGQMRLVGPRPALPDEVAAYTEDERRRLAVRPGITGLWQVSGRSDLPWQETVRLDLHYVDNWSLRMDLVILCRTLRAVMGHRGAY